MQLLSITMEMKTMWPVEQCKDAQLKFNVFLLPISFFPSSFSFSLSAFFVKHATLHIARMKQRDKRRQHVTTKEKLYTIKRAWDVNRILQMRNSQLFQQQWQHECINNVNKDGRRHECQLSSARAMASPNPGIRDWGKLFWAIIKTLSLSVNPIQ